jgi:hypothetical protein
MDTVFAILAAAVLGGLQLTEDDLQAMSPFTPEGRLVRVEVIDFPLEFLPEGAVALELIPLETTDFTVFVAAARMREGWITLDTLISTGAFNPSQANAWWENGPFHIVLSSLDAAEANTNLTSWVFTDPGFELEEVYDADRAREVLDETLALLDSGDAAHAASTLCGTAFPQSRFDGHEIASRFLSACHTEAVERAGKGDWAAALVSYMGVGGAYERCGLEAEWFLDDSLLYAEGNLLSPWMTMDRLVEILDHISLVALEAGAWGIRNRADYASAVLASQE